MTSSQIIDPQQAAIPVSADTQLWKQDGALWKHDINTAKKIAAAVRTGTMGINNYFGGDITVPVGGIKESGNGRGKSLLAMDDYTELKATRIEFE